MPSVVPHRPFLVVAALSLATAGCMGGVRKEIHDSLAQARTELHAMPMVLHAQGKPDAAMGAGGDFSIDGTPVAATEGQRQRVDAYHQAMLAYGDAALDVAEKEAVPLARRATLRALFGALTGTSERAERNIDKDSARLERKVTRLCPQLREAWSAQQALADVLPEFRPYAGLEEQEVEPCLG